MNHSRAIFALSIACPLIALAFLLHGSPLESDFDIFWHLKSGETMLQTKHLLMQDTFSYLSKGLPDESPFAWASQISFALAYRLGNFTGLWVLNFILIASAIIFASRYVWLKTKNPLATTLAGCLFLLIHAEKQQVRPMLFGEFFFAFFVFILVVEAEPLTRKRAWAAVALTAVWMQFHSSALILIPVVAIHSFCVAMDIWSGRTQNTRPPRTLFSTLCLPIACAAACLINPCGYQLFFRAREIAPIAKALGIGEWTPWDPWSNLSSFSSMIQIFGIPLCLAFFFLNGKSNFKRLYPLLLSILFCLLPFFSRRFRFFLVYVAVHLTVEACLFVRRVVIHRLPKQLSVGAYAATISILLFSGFYRSTSLVVGVRTASNFLSETGVEGNLFAFPFCASYFLFQHFPKLRTGLDGRLWLHRKYFGMLAEKMGARISLAPAIVLTRDTDLVLERSLVGSMQSYLDPKTWIVIFENSQVSIGLNRNARENLKKVEDYYLRNKISFDPNIGYVPSIAFRENPQWFREHQEEQITGLWPTDDTAKLRDRWEAIYARLRHVPPA
jgi:hypothetical protein